MSTILFIFLILLSAFMVWYVKSHVLYKIKINSKLKSIPALRGELPLFGHIWEFMKRKYSTPENIHNSVVDLLKDVGEEHRMWLFNYHLLATSKPSTIEKVLLNSETVEKSYIYKFFSGASGGIFSASIDRWRKLRKKLNMTFNPKFISHYIDQMNYQTNIFINILHSKVEDSARSSGEKMLIVDNALPLLSQYFFDTVSSTHLGINTKQQFSDKPNLAEEVTWLTGVVLKRIIQPWLHSYYLFSKTKLFKQMRQVLASLRSTVINLTAASEQYQKVIDEYPSSITGWKSYSVHCKELLQEVDHADPSPSLVGKTMTDILIAGSDTSAVATSMILYHIGLHPEYQELAYKEIMELYNDDDHQLNKSYDLDDPANSLEFQNIEYKWEPTKFFPEGFSVWTKNKMDRLDYVEMLVKESVRLTCPPNIFRYIPKDIDCDDFTIPGETDVCIMIRSAHRDPRYYEKPEEFYPDHFTKENIKRRPKMAFIPFSFGPRDCPGKAFGMYAMKCVLAEIIRNYIIVTEPLEEPVQYKILFMIEHSKGYPIKLIPRNK